MSGICERLGVKIPGATRPKTGLGRACSIEAKALLIHPPHQGVCGRHGTEEQCVTSGGLTESPGGTGVSEPISTSERASEARSVVGRLSSTTKRGESHATAQAATGMGRGRQPAKMVGTSKRGRMSKGGEVEQFRE